MSRTPQESVEQAVTFRMSVGRAIAGTAGFYLCLFIFLSATLFPLLRGSWANLLDVLPVFAFLSVASGFGMRELQKVSISPAGIGSRRRPTYWSEITEVERVGRLSRSWHVHATYRPTVIVVDSIARTPEFRDAVDRFSPPDNAIREMTGAPRE